VKNFRNFKKVEGLGGGERIPARMRTSARRSRNRNVGIQHGERTTRKGGVSLRAGKKDAARCALIKSGALLMLGGGFSATQKGKRRSTGGT